MDVPDPKTKNRPKSGYVIFADGCHVYGLCHPGSGKMLTSLDAGIYYFNNELREAGIAQLVEHHLAKVNVAGSSPVSRFSPATGGTCSRFAANDSWWVVRSLTVNYLL